MLSVFIGHTQKVFIVTVIQIDLFVEFWMYLTEGIVAFAQAQAKYSHQLL